ncbi:MAG: hypothetical protein QOH57_3406 [Mycobacterium sp.]|jgi:hypothetical protein|nr:hypothetical protein [Pseudonocardiales bacterium]MDT5011789.1 hypothetical protein [Mycobacterium sp.]
MHRITSRARRIAVVLAFAVLATACSSSGAPPATSPPSFCDTMKQVTDLLAPNAGSRAPAATKARYDSVLTLLGQAKKSAPPRLVDDLATYADAIRGFTVALAKVGYDLDAVLKTHKGVKLAADTSHALSAAIVHELVGPCGIDLGPSHAPN